MQDSHACYYDCVFALNITSYAYIANYYMRKAGNYYMYDVDQYVVPAEPIAFPNTWVPLQFVNSLHQLKGTLMPLIL